MGIAKAVINGVMNNNNPTSREAYSRFFPSEANSDQSTATATATATGYNNNNNNNNISGNNNNSSTTVVEQGINVNTTIGLQRNYGGLNHEGGSFGNIVSSPNSSMPSSSSSSPQLVRHSSSPAGLLNQLAHASGASNDDNGFPTNRTRNLSRLNTQLSFTRPQALTHISEEHENVDVDDLNQECDPRKTSHSHNHSSSYGLGAWEINPAGSVMISMGPSKRSDNITGDIVNNSLSAMESQQLQFSMLQPALVEMSSMDKLLNIPQDSVPCKIRAKRGFATHPRSIAERERRTRISGKLKKLQDLVPNMDKQTSYADMLDLAVQHIQGLQNQVQMLDKELEHCTCGCKKPQSAD